MKYQATTPDAYVQEVDDKRRPAFAQLRKTIQEHIPAGFEEVMSYGMIGYVVPHSRYPSGYHCAPELPLPFMNIAAQKSHIALYHSGIYADPALLAWFQAEYAKAVPTKLDMGKSCIRFKNPDRIPFALIGELATKMTPDDWIALYEKAVKNR